MTTAYRIYSEFQAIPNTEAQSIVQGLHTTVRLPVTDEEGDGIDLGQSTNSVAVTAEFFELNASLSGQNLTVDGYKPLKAGSANVPQRALSTTVPPSPDNTSIDLEIPSDLWPDPISFESQMRPFVVLWFEVTRGTEIVIGAYGLLIERGRISGA